MFLQEQYMNFSCSPSLSWLFAEAKSSNVLIQEMELLGVQEATIRWIGSFLTDRSQRVQVCQVYFASSYTEWGNTTRNKTRAIAVRHISEQSV